MTYWRSRLPTVRPASGEWCDIAGYEGRYLVSRDGRIFSLLSGFTLRPKFTADEYLKVNLFDAESRRSTKLVHRLVAAAFVLNPENKPCINHLDCVRSNNAAANLEWCTHAENLQHGMKYGNIEGTRFKSKSSTVQSALS
jgi:hypothetical protein